MILSFLSLIRPLSNTKNIALFLLAFYFSGSNFNLNLVILGILSISLICSASYCYNSYTDFLIDQKNANKIHYSSAVKDFGYKNIPYIFFSMSIVGIILGFLINSSFFIILLMLLLTNFLYSAPYTRFKEKPILDILFGAFLTYPLRFLGGWYIFTNNIPPFLVLISLAFAKSGGYMMYKKIDQKYLSKLNVKNSITLLSKKQFIYVASIFIAFSITSFIFLCLNSAYFKISFLGSLPLNFLYLLPLAAPPLIVMHRQTHQLTKIDNRLLRRIGFVYFAFVILIAWTLL